MRKAKHVTEELSKKIKHELAAACLIHSALTDPLTEVLRKGARRILALAVEDEVEEFVNKYKDLTDNQGHQAIGRNGYLPERNLLTGLA